MTRMTVNLFKGLLATAASTLFFVSVGATPASAVNFGLNFGIDQSCGGSGLCSEAGGTLTGIDNINFNYAGIVTQAADGTFTETGFMAWTGFLDDSGNPVTPSFLNADYKVYGLFTGHGTAAPGGPGEILASFSDFTITFYMDDNLNSTPHADATVTGTTADDNAIASASLLNNGLADLKPFQALAKGNYEIILSDFGRTLFGESFFNSPDPFYTFVDFGGQTLQVSGIPNPITFPFVADLAGSGNMFFIPEPTTLGLIGFGLLSMGTFLYRRRQTVSV
ncbi:MAG: flocculation-associated PEP-CTERM protein PepA [Alphaproteobacteria bacterium]